MNLMASGVVTESESLSFPTGAVLARPLRSIQPMLNQLLYTTIGVIPYHVGIYIGQGQVIHFSGEPKSHAEEAVIRRDQLREFSWNTAAIGETPLCFQTFMYRNPLSEDHGAVIVEKAKTILSDPFNAYNHSYHFIHNNCEDFVKECYEANGYAAYGKTQVEKFGKSLVKLVFRLFKTVAYFSKRHSR